MNAMKSTLLLLFLFAFISVGFRPISPEERARQLIKQSENHFGVTEHAELYRYVRVTQSGDVYDGRMLIIFRYHEDQVNGVFRLLPDNDNKGVTLISRQLKGELPELAYFDHNDGKGGPVTLDRLKQKLGDTDWFFEGIYDDDKNPWTYRKTGVVEHRGQNCDVIEARYNNPKLRDAVGYDYRRIFVRQSDQQPLCSEFFDNDQIIYAIELLSSESFEFQGHSQMRTMQLQLIDFKEGSCTVLTRIRSNWNPTLPPEIFDLSKAQDWNAETDAMITRKLMSDRVPQ